MSCRNAFCRFWKFENREHQDIYSVLESVKWIWRGSGISIVVPKGSIRERKFIRNKFLVIYNILLLSLITMSFIDLSVNENRIRIMNALGMDLKILWFVRLHLNWVSVCDVFLWKTIVNNKFIETIDALARQDKILNNELGCQLNSKSNDKIIGIYARSYLTIYLVLSCHEFLYGFNLEIVADWMTSWIPIILHKVSICLFLSLVWLLGIRFKALNERLQFIAKSTANSQAILNSEGYVVMLRTIGSAHAQLCKIGHSFNYIFFITLFTNALEMFVFVTLSFYSFIVEMKNKKSILILSSSVCLIISCSFPMITTVIICNWTRKQAYVAEKLVHEIKVQENCSILSELVQVFSMQMFHEQLSFSVGGLFTVDPALLQAIMGVITVNLIILVQFGQLESILLERN